MRNVALLLSQSSPLIIRDGRKRVADLHPEHDGAIEQLVHFLGVRDQCTLAILPVRRQGGTDGKLPCAVSTACAHLPRTSPVHC